MPLRNTSCDLAMINMYNSYASVLNDDNKTKDATKRMVVMELRDNIDQIIASKHYERFLRFSLPNILLVLEEGFPCFTGELPQQIARKTLLELLDRLPKDATFLPYRNQLQLLCLQILRRDNEQNGLVCIRILADLYRLDRPPDVQHLCSVLELIRVVFKRLPRHMPAMFEPFRVDPAQDFKHQVGYLKSQVHFTPYVITSADSRAGDDREQYTILPNAIRSLRVLQELPQLVQEIQNSYTAAELGDGVGEALAALIPGFLSILAVQVERMLASHNKQPSETSVEFSGVQARVLRHLSHVARARPEGAMAVLHGAALVKMSLQLVLLAPNRWRNELLTTVLSLVTPATALWFLPWMGHMCQDQLLIGRGNPSLRPLICVIQLRLVTLLMTRMKLIELDLALNQFCRNLLDSNMPNSLHVALCGELAQLAKCLMSFACDRPNDVRELHTRLQHAFLLKLKFVVKVLLPQLDPTHYGADTTEQLKAPPNGKRNAAEPSRKAPPSNPDRFLLGPDLPPPQRWDGAECRRLVIALLRAVSDTAKVSPTSTLQMGAKSDPSLLVRVIRWSVRCLRLYDLEQPTEDRFAALDHIVDMFASVSSDSTAFIYPVFLPSVLDPPCLPLVKALLQRQSTARPFTRALLDHMATRVADLADEELLLDMLVCVLRSPHPNQAALEKFVNEVVGRCMDLGSAAKDPMPYFRLTQLVFQGANKYRVTLRQASVYALFRRLYNISRGHQTPKVKQAAIALCLTFPAPLHRIMPLLPLALEVAVAALDSDTDSLNSQGLKTLDVFLADIPLDHLLTMGRHVLSRLSRATWRLMRHKDLWVRNAALRLAGKLGGVGRAGMWDRDELKRETEGEGPAMLVQLAGRVDVLCLPMAQVIATAVATLKDGSALLYYQRHSWVVIKSFLVASVSMEDDEDSLKRLFTHPSFSDSKNLLSDFKGPPYKLADRAARETLIAALTGMFMAATLPDLQSEASNMVAFTAQFYTLMHVAQHAGPLRLDSPSKQTYGMDSLVLVDAVVEVLCQDEQLAVRQALLAVMLLAKSAEAVLKSKEKVFNLPLLCYLTEQVCSLCCREGPNAKKAGYFALKCMLKHFGPVWALKHLLEIVRVVFVVIRDLASEVTLGYDERYMSLLERMISVSCKRTQFDFTETCLSKKSLVDATREIVLNVSSQNQKLRKYAMQLLRLIAHEQNISVTLLLEPHKHIILNFLPLRKKMMPQYSFQEQEGILDTFTFCSELQPRLITLDPRIANHYRFLEELIHIVRVRDDNPAQSLYCIDPTLYVPVRCAALRTLSTLAYIAVHRARLVDVMFVAMSCSERPEVQEAAFHALDIFTDAYDPNESRNELFVGMSYFFPWPSNEDPLETDTVAVSQCRLVRYFMRLMPNCAPYICQQLMPRLWLQIKRHSLRVGGGHELGDATTTIDILVDALCYVRLSELNIRDLCAMHACTVAAVHPRYLEARSLLSERLINVLNKNAVTAVNYFLSALQDRYARTYMKYLLCHDQCAPLRAEMQTRKDTLCALLNVPDVAPQIYVDMTNMQYQVLRIVYILMKRDNDWLANDKNFISKFKLIWYQDQFHVIHTNSTYTQGSRPFIPSQQSNPDQCPTAATGVCPSAQTPLHPAPAMPPGTSVQRPNFPPLADLSQRQHGAVPSQVMNAGCYMTAAAGSTQHGQATAGPSQGAPTQHCHLTTGLTQDPAQLNQATAGPTQRVPTQHVPTQRIPTQQIPTQSVTTQHVATQQGQAPQGPIQHGQSSAGAPQRATQLTLRSSRLVCRSHWNAPRLLAKILLNYLEHNLGDIELLFQLLRAFCGRYIVDFTFLRTFVSATVVRGLPTVWKRVMFFIMLDMFTRKPIVSDQLKAEILRLVTRCFEEAFARGEGNELLGHRPDEDLQESALTKFTRIMVDPKNPLKFEACLRAQIARMSCLLVSQSSHIQLQAPGPVPEPGSNAAGVHPVASVRPTASQHLLQMINYATTCLSVCNIIDPLARYQGYLMVAHIATKHSVKTKVLYDAHHSLLQPHATTEERTYARQALRLITPLLGQADEVQGRCLIYERAKNLIATNTRLGPDVVFILDAVVQNNKVYYKAKDHGLTALMCKYVPQLCRSGGRNTHLAMDLIEVIIRWELRRLGQHSDRAAKFRSNAPKLVLMPKLEMTSALSRSQSPVNNTSQGVPQGSFISLGVQQSLSVTQGVPQGSYMLQGVQQDPSVSQGVLQGLFMPQGVQQGSSVTKGILQGSSITQGMPQGSPMSQGMPQGLSRSPGVSQAILQVVHQGSPSPQGMPSSPMTQSIPQGSSMSQGVPQGSFMSQGVPQGLSWSQGVLQGSSMTQGVPQAATLMQVIPQAPPGLLGRYSHARSLPPPHAVLPTMHPDSNVSYQPQYGAPRGNTAVYMSPAGQMAMFKVGNLACSSPGLSGMYGSAPLASGGASHMPAQRSAGGAIIRPSRTDVPLSSKQVQAQMPHHAQFLPHAQLPSHAQFPPHVQLPPHLQLPPHAQLPPASPGVAGCRVPTSMPPVTFNYADIMHLIFEVACQTSPYYDSEDDTWLDTLIRDLSTMSNSTETTWKGTIATDSDKASTGTRSTDNTVTGSAPNSVPSWAAGSSGNVSFDTFADKLSRNAESAVKSIAEITAQIKQASGAETAGTSSSDATAGVKSSESAPKETAPSKRSPAPSRAVTDRCLELLELMIRQNLCRPVPPHLRLTILIDTLATCTDTEKVCTALRLFACLVEYLGKERARKLVFYQNIAPVAGPRAKDSNLLNALHSLVSTLMGRFPTRTTLDGAETGPGGLCVPQVLSELHTLMFKLVFLFPLHPATTGTIEVEQLNMWVKTLILGGLRCFAPLRVLELTLEALEMLFLYDYKVIDDAVCRHLMQALRHLSALAVKEARGADNWNAVVVLVTVLNMLKDHVMEMKSDLRNSFSGIVVELIDKCHSVKVFKAIVNMVEEWVRNGDPEKPNSRLFESYKLVLRMMPIMEERFPAASRLHRKYLEVVHNILDNKIKPTEGLRTMLRPAVLWGIRHSDPTTRSKMAAYFDTTVKRGLEKRVVFISTAEAWWEMAPHYWISQAIALMYSSALHVCGAVTVPVQLYNSAHQVKGTASIINMAGKDKAAAFAAAQACYDDKRGCGGYKMAAGEEKGSDTQFTMKELLNIVQLLDDFSNYHSTKLLHSVGQLCHLDAGLAHSVWLGMYPQLWTVLSTANRTAISKMITFVSREQPHTSQQEYGPSALGTFVAGLTLCDPLPTFSPSILKHLGKRHNEWHRVALTLEKMYLTTTTEVVVSNEEDSQPPENRQQECLSALCGMYTALECDDMAVGLRQAVWKRCRHTLALLQHGEHEQAREAQQEAMSEILGELRGMPADDATLEEMGCLAEVWGRCTQELNEWDSLLNPIVGTVFQNMEAQWRLEKWTDLKQSLRSVEEGCPLELQWKMSMYRGYMSLCCPEDDDPAFGLVNLYAAAARDAFLREWNRLPAVVAEGHLQTLYGAQLIVELREAGEMQRCLNYGRDPSPVLGRWDLRRALVSDDLSHCSAVCSWREINCRLVTARCGDAANGREAGLRCLAELCQEQFLTDLSGVALKRDAPLLCLDLVLSAVSRTSALSVHLPNVMLAAESFARMGNMSQALAVVENAVVQHMTHPEVARYLALRGTVFSLIGLDGADTLFSMAAQIDLTSSEVWSRWGQYLEAAGGPHDLAAMTHCSLSACITADRLAARGHVAKLLWLLASDDEERTVAKAVSGSWEVPLRHWLPWLPQLLNLCVEKCCKLLASLIHKICVMHPQEAFFPVRRTSAKIFSEAMKAGVGTSATNPLVMIFKAILDGVTKVHPYVANALDAICKELQCLHGDWYEDLLHNLRQVLANCWRVAFKCQGRLSEMLVPESMRTTVAHLLMTFGPRRDSQQSRTVTLFAAQESPEQQMCMIRFANDFSLNQRGDSWLLFGFVATLRRWIALLREAVALTPRSFTLATKYLSSFSQDICKLNLPGTCVDQWPSVVYICRFSRRMRIVGTLRTPARGLDILASDGRTYSYIMAKYSNLAEERVSRTLRMLNDYLHDSKETSRRLLNFTVPWMTTLSHNCRLVEDPGNCSSLADICQRYGQASKVDIEASVQQFYEKLACMQVPDKSSQPVISHNMRQTVCREMQAKVPSTLLRDWAMKTFPGPIEYWTFRNTLTTQLALTYLAEHALHLTRLDADQLFVQETTGLVNVAYFKFDIDQDRDDGSFRPTRRVAFRLSANLTAFLGGPCIDGALTACMTAAARCLSQPSCRLDTLLSVMLRDQLADHVKGADPCTAVNWRQQVELSSVTKLVKAVTARMEALTMFQGTDGPVKTLITEAQNPDMHCHMDPAWMYWV